MEWKLGSVWLLLSCSLQQSLWGILASVPKTHAEKCSQISSDGEQFKAVKTIRRIPARCSGWDEAWSWISKVDCRTKYVYDFVELPRAVEKVDMSDCKEEEEATKFDVTDEKFLAIVFGSATVALLILVVIIIIGVVRRGQSRCGMCGSGPSYTSASDSEREHLEREEHQSNECGEAIKVGDPIYEEINDQKKHGHRDGNSASRYQNLPEVHGGDEKEGGVNGVQAGGLVLPASTVVPSAPYEEDLQQTSPKCMLNEYSEFQAGRLMNTQCRENVTLEKQADVNGECLRMSMLKSVEERAENANENNNCNECDVKTPDVCKGKNEACDGKRKNSEKKCDSDSAKVENVYSKFDDLIPENKVESVCKAPPRSPVTPVLDYEEPISAPHRVSHIYENNAQQIYENSDSNTKDPDPSGEYESLSTVNSEPQTVTLYSPSENTPAQSELEDQTGSSLVTTQSSVSDTTDQNGELT